MGYHFQIYMYFDDHQSIKFEVSNMCKIYSDCIVVVDPPIMFMSKEASSPFSTLLTNSTCQEVCAKVCDSTSPSHQAFLCLGESLLTEKSSPLLGQHKKICLHKYLKHKSDLLMFTK
jgi:hypothetical protein